MKTTFSGKSRKLPCERVADVLRVRAARADAPGASLGSEVKLAEECGVSRMTVRKAVNALVAEGLIERRAGVGLFVRDPEARVETYRFLACNLVWDCALKIASGLRRAVLSSGGDVQLRDAVGDIGVFLREISELTSSGADGAVVLSPHAPGFADAVRGVAESGFNIVVVDEAVDGVPCVVSDNEAGGRLAAEAVFAAGLRRAAFIGDVDAGTVRARVSGFTAAWRGRARPVTINVSAMRAAGDWENSMHGVVDDILALPAAKRPEALFCSCDAIARGVYRALEARGLSVPDDFSVVGFDDDPIAEWLHPALATVRQDFTAMGEAAARALSSGESVTAPVEFVDRGSLQNVSKS